MAASHSTAFPQITLAIKQTADEIMIETRSSDVSNGTVSTESLTYKLDGGESSMPVNSGKPIKTKAYWEGGKLITETNRSIQSVPVTTRYIFRGCGWAGTDG